MQIMELSMKKSVLFFSRIYSLLIAGLLVLCLSSCAGLLQRTGSVSFEIDKALVQAARDGGYDGPVMRFEVSLEGNGGYGIKQTIFIPMEDYEACMQTDKKFEANFDNIPTGKTYYAYIRVYSDKEAGMTGGPETEPILIGRSKAFKVKAGENIVDMKAFSYRCEYDFSLEITVPEEWGYTEAEVSELQNDLFFDVILADTSVAKKLIAAGTDKYKLYDVFSKNALPSVMNFNYIPGSERITFGNDGSTLQIEGKIDLPVDENTYGTCGKEVIFIASAKNYEEPAPYLYGKSARVTPVKNSILNAVFEINKIKVLETPLLTYNVSGSGDSKTYSYKLGDKSPIEVTNSDFFTCFDADGNFISVSKNDGDSTYTYTIISSDRNEEITVSNVPYIFTGVTCDLETNKVYVYEINTDEPLRLWDITEIKNTSIGTIEFSDTTITIDYQTVANKNLINPYHVYDLNGIVINNGVLYDFVYSYELPPCLVITNTIPEGQNNLILTPDTIVNFDIDGISSLEFCKISDIVFVNNALYVLFNYKEDTVSGMVCASDNAKINSRGVLVKYDTKTKNIKKLGWIDSALNNTGTSISLIPYNYNLSDVKNSILYITHPDNNNQLKMTPDPNKTYYDYTFADIYPKFYTPKSVDSYSFFGPEKIIAIKPKQLVIADDGRAFYTDNLGTYRYKNVNRIVTVDLESFSITNVATADCTFDTEYTDFLMSSNYLTTDVITSQYASLRDKGDGENYNQYNEPIDTRLYIPLEDD